MITRLDSEERFIRQMKDGICLFTGAGFSVLASNEADEELPVGNGLLDELKETFEQIKEFPDLAKASTILENTYKEEFYDYLIKRFTIAEYDSLYDVLPKLCISDIFTTNIDDLIYKIYEQSDIKYINTTTIEGTPVGSGMAVNYSPLHGCVRRPDRGFIFSKTKLASAYTNQRDDWTNLRNTIGSKPILFWGWSFEDSDAIEAIYSGTSGFNKNEYKWILLKDPKPYEIMFYETLGFKIIIGDTRSLLELMNSINMAETLDEDENNSVILPEYSIPKESNTANHPLISFFEGDAPQWSHIRSGDIYKLHHYTTVCNLIDKGKNVFVIGIPASGKSTLMMQLIYEYPAKVPKHFLRSPSLNEVLLYLKKLGGRSSLVFIDDCLRDYKAVIELLNSPNCQIVCFDRDYSYESQVYRIRDAHVRFEVVDITEISDVDARQIINSIPSSIKKSETTIKIKDKTVYSVLSKNTRNTRFDKRFRQMIRDFYKENPVATELFIMICYVHSCGVPVSYDMIFAYLSDLDLDYTGIYQYINEVGNIIIECGNDTFSFLNVNFDEQDYYQSRSRYFAEQIMNSLPHEPNVLKNVLERFVENVPSFLICRYDVFKRSAYDAELAVKAFPKVEDGEAFYYKCAEIDDSEYIYQQAALYFSKKKRHSLAFKWIERAKNYSSFNRFSIENTHAIIQFNANIEVEEDENSDVNKLLRDSLDTLMDCYNGDRRKNVHVMSFATLSCKYYDRYYDYESIEYVRKAREWLEDEMSSGDCGYRLKKNMGKTLKKLNDIISEN